MDEPPRRPAQYAPQAYRATDPASIVRAYPFALLVTATEAGIFATPTPIVFEREDGADALVGHMARANPHAGVLAAGQPTLAVFIGPHAYISSRWYQAKPTVPTWNYLQAQVRGTLEPIDDPEGHLAVLRRTAAVLEAGADAPWTLDQAPAGRVEDLLPRIRSFRIRIEQLEGASKLSQTHPAADRVRVIRGLLEEGAEGAVEIARLMAALGIEDACG